MIELDPITAGDAPTAEEFAERIGITIIAHRLNKKGEVVEEAHRFEFSAINPYSAFLNLMSSAGTYRSLGAQQDYVEAAMVSDDERERFNQVIREPGLQVGLTLMDDLSTALVRAYTDRPTSSRSASTRGGSRGGTRSTGAAGARASATSANGQPA